MLLSGRGAAALLDNAVAPARPHVNYACRDEMLCKLRFYGKIKRNPLRRKVLFLKRIEINGFKSFANKTEILLNNRITGIVGQNFCAAAS